MYKRGRAGTALARTRFNRGRPCLAKARSRSRLRASCPSLSHRGGTDEGERRLLKSSWEPITRVTQGRIARFHLPRSRENTTLLALSPSLSLSVSPSCRWLLTRKLCCCFVGEWRGEGGFEKKYCLLLVKDEIVVLSTLDLPKFHAFSNDTILEGFFLFCILTHVVFFKSLNSVLEPLKP